MAAQTSTNTSRASKRTIQNYKQKPRPAQKEPAYTIRASAQHTRTTILAAVFSGLSVGFLIIVCVTYVR